MSQMFCRRPHTADAKVLSQASPHGISWAQISTRTCLSVSKGEDFPFHAKQVQRNGISAALSTLDRGAKRGLGVDGKRQSPAAFLPVKRDLLPNFTGSCMSTGPSWMGLENLCPQGFKSRTLQHLTRRTLRYIRDSIIPPMLHIHTWYFIHLPTLAGIAQSVQRLATGWTVRGSNSGVGEIFRTCPDRPWGLPSLLYNGYRVFLGGKAAGAWCWPPTPI